MEPSAIDLELVNVPPVLQHKIIWSENGVKRNIDNKVKFVIDAVCIREDYRREIMRNLDKISLGIRHGGLSQNRTRGLISRVVSFLGGSFMMSTFQGQLLLQGKEVLNKIGLGKGITRDKYGKPYKNVAKNVEEALTFDYDVGRRKLFIRINKIDNPEFYNIAYQNEYGGYKGNKLNTFSRAKEIMKLKYPGKVK